MNKKTIITILLALVAVTGQGQTINWRIEGTVENASSTDTLIVINALNRKEITTLPVKDGRIQPVNGTLDEPAVCMIGRRGRNRWIRELVLEEGTVNISVDMNAGYLRNVGGTPLNDEVGALLALQFQKADHDTYHKKMYDAVTGIVTKHPDHVISPFLISSRIYVHTPTESLSLIDKLSTRLKASPDMDRLKEQLVVEQETEVGRMFKDMKGITPDGKPINLSDFVGRGNYVLADFWASWCSPCIAEIPHVIELHEKYKDKGLKVIGITVRDAPEKSGKMVEEKHIPFPQIYESKPMSTYGVLGIPYTILFAPDGTIIERGPLFVVEKIISAIFDESK